MIVSQEFTHGFIGGMLVMALLCIIAEIFAGIVSRLIWRRPLGK